MKVVIFDIETDSLDATKIWCIVCKELRGKSFHWDIDSGYEGFLEYAKTVDKWVAHNGISFDAPTVNRLLGHCIDHEKVCDTFVVSRLVNYSSYKGHGLDEIGASLGTRKTPFNSFGEYTPEMLSYCYDDVTLGEMIYIHFERFINDPDWVKSIKVEHDIANVCHTMHTNGFMFDEQLARSVLPQIERKLAELEASFQIIWPPSLKEVNRIQYKFKGDGTLYQTVLNAQANYPKTEIDYETDELVCYDYVSFNPGSPKDRVEKLWEAGWDPTEKTKTHYQFGLKAKPGEAWGKTLLTHAMYEEKKKHFEFYGWTVSEENLLTLPEDTPEGVSALAEWLTLNGRLKALQERLRELEPDSRIRTTFWHIGAWTHRMSHSSPNLANISSPFHGEPKNAVERVKAKYDADMRRMFTVPNGYLVGTDAESIQLRILAHYLKNDDYVEAIVNGRKEDQTDIHNLNRRALVLNHLTRDHAKTFILTLG